MIDLHFSENLEKNRRAKIINVKPPSPGRSTTSRPTRPTGSLDCSRSLDLSKKTYKLYHRPLEEYKPQRSRCQAKEDMFNTRLRMKFNKNKSCKDMNSWGKNMIYRGGFKGE